MQKEIPSKIKAPILIAADAQCQQLMCFVDSEPLHCSEPIEAVLLLLAAYYIFNISYEKVHNLQFILLEYLIFGDKVLEISPGNSKYVSILNILDAAGITQKFYEMPSLEKK